MSCIIHTYTVLAPQSPRYSPKTLTLDLSSSSSLTDRAQEAIKAFGRVDILVNNAGISSRGAVLDTDMAVDRMLMETNFFGTIALTKGTTSHTLLPLRPPALPLPPPTVPSIPLPSFLTSSLPPSSSAPLYAGTRRRPCGGCQ